MSPEKTEATRLADEAGNEIGKEDPQWEVIDAAIEMLRRWPDGKPAEYQILVNGGGWRRCAKHIYDVAIRTGAGTVRALYTAPPDQSARIAALEAALAERERPTVAIGAKASEWKTLSPQAQALIQQAAQKAVDRWSEQQKLDGAARAATPLVPLGASDLDRAHGGIDERIAALEAALAERDRVIEQMKVEMREMKSSYDIMGLAEEQRQRPGPFGGPGTPNALLRDIEEVRK